MTYTLYFDPDGTDCLLWDGDERPSCADGLPMTHHVEAVDYADAVRQQYEFMRWQRVEALEG